MMKILTTIQRKITEGYTEIWQYFIYNKKLMIFWLLLLVEMVVFFILNGSPDPRSIENLTTSPNNYPNLFLFIFLGNLKAAMMTILAGVIPGFLGSIFVLMMTVKSIVVTTKTIATTISVGTIILSVIPHGIFEIPAIILSILLSSIISTVALCTLFRKKILNIQGLTSVNLKTQLRYAVISFVYIIFPLLLIAAIVEVTISPLVIERLLLT